MCLVPYVQAAAQNGEFRPEANFDPLPNEQNPLVFPGMELTIGQGCQVIVLLDPQSAPKAQELLLNTLCGTTMERENPKGPEFVQLKFTTPAALDERLRSTPDLKGQYLLLPNVGDGGQHTWLREGFAPIYARMPCVGGYVDGRLKAIATCIGSKDKIRTGETKLSPCSRQAIFAAGGCCLTKLKKRIRLIR
ncbi:MAG: hypothetical protein V1790_11330 [Planctomycetota bacterium]